MQHQGPGLSVAELATAADLPRREVTQLLARHFPSYLPARPPRTPARQAVQVARVGELIAANVPVQQIPSKLGIPRETFRRILDTHYPDFSRRPSTPPSAEE